MSRRWAMLRCAALGCLVPALLLLAQVFHMRAKAALAGLLIDRAYLAHCRDGERHLPWSWADTHPIARLEFPRLDAGRPVLAGASGSSLAFGVGHVNGTAQPGSTGNCVLAGHRDGAFALLEELRRGDWVRLEGPWGETGYRVVSSRVVPRHETRVLAPQTGQVLNLVTCYPLRGLRPSDLRYVVTCRTSPHEAAFPAPSLWESGKKMPVSRAFQPLPTR